VSSTVVHGFAEHFARLSADVELDHDQPQVLGLLARTAVELVPNCSWAATVQVDARARAHPLVSHGEPGALAAGMERGAGEGPSITAALTAATVHAPDLATESRWPQLAERLATGTPVRTAVAAPLTGDRASTVLTLYGAQPHAFEGVAGELARAYLAHARALVRYTVALDKIDNLGVALSTSRLIGSAVGIVMHTYTLNYDDAFDLLRRTSEVMKIKVRTLAAHVVDTGTPPPSADDADPFADRARWWGST
jgi:hypothetical protein